jgi:hypothetical protein
MNGIKIISLLALALALACDEPAEPENVTESTETETEVEEAPTPSIDLASIASRIGGLRMVVGQFGVELRPEARGVLKAYVSNADGAAVQDAELEVEMQGADGQPHSVTLAWDANASAYVGTMADATPAPGAATVKVTANGETSEAEVASVGVAPTPVYGGHVVLVGDVAAEVRPEADGVLYVSAKQGDAYLGADADVDLKISVATEAGQAAEVPVVWDEPSAGYVAVLPEGTTIANGNLSLVATIGGQEYSSGIADVSVAAPAHEGDVVAVGDMNVELVPSGGGALEAYVTGPSGDAAAGADVSIEVEGVDTPVVLAWDEGAGCYKGEVAADVDVSTAPLQVVVNHEGKARRGGIAVAAGRRLGVAWRSRVESGEGGAIPPGQQMRLAANTEVRGRHSGTAVAEAGADVEVNVSAMGAAGAARAEAAMVRAQANMAAGQARAEAERARAAAVNARGQAERARVRAQAQANMAAAQVRPPSVMVSAGAGAGGMASGGMASGSASVMIGF